MASKVLDFIVRGNTKDGDVKLDDLTGKLKKLTDRVWKAKVGAELQDSVKLRQYEMTLDRLSKKVARPKVSSEGLAKANLEADKLLLKMDALGEKSARLGFFRSRTGRFGQNLLKLPFSGNAISQLFTGSEGSIGGIGSLLASPLGLGAAGIGVGLLPALAGGLGAFGIGGAGLALASKYDKKGFARDLAPVSGVLKNIGGSVGKDFEPVLRQFAGFVKSIGPELKNMFQASVPAIAQFVRALEPAVKQALPALAQFLHTLVKSGLMTALGKAFGTLLVDSVRALNGLSKGFKASGQLIKQVARVIGAAIELLGRIIGGVVRTVGDLIHGKWSAAWHDALSTFRSVARIIDTDLGGLAHNVAAWFDRIRHSTSSIFDGIRHDIASTWDRIYSDTVGKVIRLVNTVVGWFRKLPGEIGSALSSIPGIIANAIPGGGILGSLGGIASKVLHLAKGGVLREPVVGTGLRTGTTYTLAEYSAELITPIGRAPSFGAGLHDGVMPSGAGSSGSGDIYITVTGDFANPDATALRIAQVLRSYKLRHGNTLGIA
jgi:hypothetical protein